MSDLTTEGISALKTGNRVRARNFLKLAIQENPKNIKAWLWLSGAVEDEDERMMCLLTVLKLEPENEAATRGLSEIMARRAVAEPQPVEQSVVQSTRLEEAEIASLEADAGAADFSDDRAAEESAASLFQVPPAELEAEPEMEMAEPAFEMAAGEQAEPAGQWGSAEAAPAAEEWFAAEGPRAEEEIAISTEAAGETGMLEEASPSEPIQEPVEESTQEIPVEKPKDPIIFNLGPSWGYGLAVLVLLLIVMAALFVAAFVYLRPWSGLVAAGLAILWLLIAAGVLLTPISYRYFLTGKHLVIDKGFIARKRTAIPLAGLDAVQLHQDLFQKILGVGDIALIQEGTPRKARLKNIPKPKIRRDEIQSAWNPPPPEPGPDQPA